MGPKDADGMANSADPDQTAPRSSLIWVCTVCPDLSVQKFRIITAGGVKLKDLQEIEPSPSTSRIESQHNKTSKMACAPSEVSDQPGHPPSLIRVFAVLMNIRLSATHCED